MKEPVYDAAAEEYLRNVAAQQATVKEEEPEEFSTPKFTPNIIDRRKGRRKAKVSEDTLAMQERYRKAGYYSIAEIAFLMANDSYEELGAIGEQYGINSKEYDDAFSRSNFAVKTALPYFAISMKAEMIQVGTQELDGKGVEDALAKMLAKRK